MIRIDDGYWDDPPATEIKATGNKGIVNATPLAKALEQQIDATIKALAGGSNNLLLRCVQAHNALNKNQALGIEFTQQEAKFLESSFVATIKQSPVYNTFSGSFERFKFEITSFIEPWDSIMTDLSKQMLSYKPARPGRTVSPS